MIITGQIVRISTRRRFKLGIVVDAARGRVCVWAANGGTWSQPQQHELGDLTPAIETDSRQRRVIKNAIDNVALAGGRVVFKGGSINVGTATTLPRSSS